MGTATGIRRVTAHRMATTRRTRLTVTSRVALRRCGHSCRRVCCSAWCSASERRASYSGPFLGGPFLFAGALAGGIAFERFIVSPLWNFTMRFASTPATTLESAITGEATAVTSFDANGQGIVSIEVDGQVVQILATLQSNDRLLGGPRVRAGQRVRIDDVNAEKNCCTVSIL